MTAGALALLAPGGLGGSTRVALRQAALALEDGRRVELFCERPVPAELCPPGMELHVWGSGGWPLAGGRTGDDAGLVALFERHSAAPFAHVLAHFALPHGELAGRLVELARAHGLALPQIVLCLHGTDVLGALGEGSGPGGALSAGALAGESSPAEVAVRRLALRRALDAAERVAVPSADLGEQLARALPGASKQVLVTPNFTLHDGREVSAPETGPGPLGVLIAGSLRPVKRAPLAVRAALEAGAQLARAGRGLALRISGEGPDLEACRALARGAPDGVTVELRSPRPLGPGDWGEAGVLLLASRYESFSLVALEALSAGVPVVAPAVGGLGELLGGVDSKRAFGVDPSLPERQLQEALSGALLRVATEPAEAARRARAGRQYALAHHGPDVGRAGLARLLEPCGGARTP